jgi:hypothetical protein
VSTDDHAAAWVPATPARRVVSIVPSLTETIASVDPGLLVGVTDYCTHPPGLTATRVGGTKNPDLAAIRSLAPDVVVANEEENRPADLEALRQAGIAVHLTVVRSLEEGLAGLRRMLSVLGLPTPGWLPLAERAWSGPPDPDRGRAVIPVWRRPWMALGSDTFAGDVLARLGVANVLADSPQRYPRFEPALLSGADLAVFPDEPYAFTPDDGPEAFPGIPARFVSGRHLTWYGPSLAEARAVLGAQLDRSDPPS